MNIQLRPWDMEDAMALHQMSMHPYYLKKRPWKFLCPDTFLNACATIQFYQQADKNRYVYRAITVDDSVCGLLNAVKRSAGAWELSYWLAVNQWHRGIMRQALALLCEEMFQNPNVMVLYACVNEQNIASCMVLRQNGFIEDKEGSIRIFRRYR